jgi:hypothetical protein
MTIITAVLLLLHVPVQSAPGMPALLKHWHDHPALPRMPLPRPAAAPFFQSCHALTFPCPFGRRMSATGALRQLLMAAALTAMVRQRQTLAQLAAAVAAAAAAPPLRPHRALEVLLWMLWRPTESAALLLALLAA